MFEELKQLSYNYAHYADYKPSQKLQSESSK